MQEESDRNLLKLGALGGIVGGVANIIGTFLHPATLPSDTGEARLTVIGQSPIWVPAHLLILIGTLASVALFVALTQSLRNTKEAGLTKLALAFGLVGSAVSCVLMSIDGFGMKVLASSWLNAPISEKIIAFRVASAFEQVELFLFSIFLIIYFGITFLIYGWVVNKSKIYPNYLGKAAVLAGSILILTGFYQLIFGLSVITIAIFTLCWTIQGVFLLLVGINMWRKRI